MRQLLRIVILLIIAVVVNEADVFCVEKDNSDNYICNTKRDILVLMMSYPEQIKDIEKTEDGHIYLIMSDNKKVLYDDKKEKTHEQKFYESDLQDTLEQIYPLYMINEVAEEGRDPGRIRCYSLLGHMYGQSKEAVEKNLVYKNTYYGGVMFNNVNNAAENLQNALNDIGRLAEKNPGIGGFISPTSGTFNYRVIKDTGQLSPHAFGIAIDLKSNQADYWKWCSREKGSSRIAIYPEEIVKTFESYGFVWGGKWSHFDILHFEYRPEIILKSKLFGDSNESSEDKDWYEGVPADENIELLINKIDDLIDY